MAWRGVIRRVHLFVFYTWKLSPLGGTLISLFCTHHPDRYLPRATYLLNIIASGISWLLPCAIVTAELPLYMTLNVLGSRTIHCLTVLRCSVGRGRVALRTSSFIQGEGRVINGHPVGQFKTCIFTSRSLNVTAFATDIIVPAGNIWRRLVLVIKDIGILSLSPSFSSQAVPILQLLTIHSFWSQNDPLILLALDDFERVEEMLLAILDGRGILLIAGEVRVNELNQPVQIFRGDLVD